MSSKKAIGKDLIYSPTSRREPPIIGGPGSKLPFAVESFLAWTLAVSCLAVSGYHYLVATFLVPTFTWLKNLRAGSRDTAGINLPCWLPLTTCSRAELDRAAPEERHRQLVAYLESITRKRAWSDKEIVEIIRSNEICRRLASLAMRPHDGDISKEPSLESLRSQLVRVWPALLMLPREDTKYKYRISLIIPAYRERGSDVRAKLGRALSACRHPNDVQVVVVDAGNCDALSSSLCDMKDSWGDFMIVEFKDGGGRGPCLNYGAAQATGRLYSFCHSDTTLPKDWDVKVLKTLTEMHASVKANSCAFAFGIDKSDAGLNGGPYPPGIKAVETTANIRSHLYSLPYGDQVLSVPASIFSYLGGYPEQCLMEDYELISLLRRRAALLQKFGVSDREALRIVEEPPALCSPRRWQRYGVLYVTFMNSKFVNLYANGLSPDGLFRLYYGRPPPARSSQFSPWEKKLTRKIH